MAERINFSYFLMVKIMGKMEPVGMVEIMVTAEIMEVVKMARTMEIMEVMGKMEIMVKLVRLVLEAVMKPQVLAKAKMM